MKLATLCYVKSGGKTLMMHRIKKKNDMHEGKWNGLGGKFNPGETPEMCARREVEEESGLIATRLILKGFLTFPQFDGTHDWYVFVFIIDEFEGELIENSPEGHLAWIDDSQLLNLNLWEGDRIFLKWLDQPPFFSGKFTYHEGVLIDHSVNFY
ncbi:MAG: 8-oxo-dGTP diphosphatase [Gemmatimonadetes bacterium]|nr:MAG: 8-oxo-dGTP diphosphatase [Gemmatimonadota bacterium]